MAKIAKGPFSIQYGNNPVVDVTEVGFNYDVATNDYETVDGRTYTIEGAITASVDLTLLATDVEALSALLPQYYVAEGQPMSTGENAPEGGAIDIVAAQCDTTETKYPLDITSCNGETVRLVNARTSLSSVDIDGASARTVTITFRGEPENSAAAIQFFKTATES